MAAPCAPWHCVRGPVRNGGSVRPLNLAVRPTMRRTSSFILLVALAPGVWAEDTLWQRLMTESDMVVFIRHTQPAGTDGLAWDQSGNCEGEAMLTSDGKAHAKRIGEAFSKRGIKPIVISSPLCRCRDTAQIAFGDKPVTDADLRAFGDTDSNQVKTFERTAQTLIATRRGSVPVVFVSHRPNIDRLTMELIDYGELIVGKANARGESEVLGKIKIQ